MKRFYSGALAVAVATAAIATPAIAELRVSQVPISETSQLQTKIDVFNGLGTINVNTEQLNAQRWRTNTAGGLTGATLMIELGDHSATHEIGVYNADDPSPVPTSLFSVFPGAAQQGWFAYARFRADTHQLIVTLFNESAVQQGGPTTHDNVNTQYFGFYIEQDVDGPTFFTQDWRQNAAGQNSPQALVFAGTNSNAGGFWLCFEDSEQGAEGSDRDFDDAIVFLEAMNPTPVARTSWAALKSRFK